MDPNVLQHTHTTGMPDLEGTMARLSAQPTGQDALQRSTEHTQQLATNDTVEAFTKEGLASKFRRDRQEWTSNKILTMAKTDKTIASITASKPSSGNRNGQKLIGECDPVLISEKALSQRVGRLQ
jgi:hypothetical protein